MNINMHQSADKAEYFLDFLITRKSLKLVNNISNQCNHQYYSIFLLIMPEIQRKLVHSKFFFWKLPIKYWK